jgi:HEPN domain-containing protein
MSYQRQFLRAAEQHLDAAQMLQEAGIYRDAVYLAGIAAECAVKSLILSHVPARQRRQFVDSEFRGAKAHNFDHLRHMMECQKCSFPSALGPHWRRLSDWTVDMRYEVSRVAPADAESFLKTAAFTITFIKERLR